MKKVILYVSILKPLTDPRADKILGTLKEHFPEHHYHIVASQNNSTTSEHPQFTLHPIANTSSRIRKILSALSICKKTNANIIIFNNIDFYWTSLFLSPFTKYIYDIRENYSKNIIHQTYYSNLSKRTTPIIIKIAEYCASKFIYGNFLAELCYKEELKNRIHPNTIILENKAKGITYSPTSIQKNFLITGTLSEEYGTISAINWFKAYHKLFPETTLTVVGKTSSLKFKRTLEKITQANTIHLNTSHYNIPYEIVKKEITACDISLLPYTNNPCFENKIPTKIYEYLSAGKIIISQKEHQYNTLLTPLNSLLINFNSTKKTDLQDVNIKIKKLKAQPTSTGYEWTSEENKLITFFDKLLR